MGAVENLNKLSKYLKINAGKIAVVDNNVPTRTTKQGTIKGYSTILHSLARELTLPQLAHAIGDVDAAAETPLLVGQWLDYCALFAEPASRDKCAATVLLKEFNEYLLTRSYLVGYALTIADVAVFLGVSPIVSGLSYTDKEKYQNVSRWFDHIQNVTNFRQPSRNFVNFPYTRN